jgi:hypothetical protein
MARDRELWEQRLEDIEHNQQGSQGRGPYEKETPKEKKIRIKEFRKSIVPSKTSKTKK